MKGVVRSVANPSLRDRAVSLRYRAESTARVVGMGFRQGPRRMAQALRRYPWLRLFLQARDLQDNMTRGRRGFYREANAYLFSSLSAAMVEMLEALLESPERTVLHEDLIPPEILFGMGLSPWMTELLGVMVPMICPSYMEEFIDVAESAGAPPDTCSLPKSTMGLVLEGQMPKPVAMVTSNMPCDGGMSQYTIIERELGVPTYQLDVPYHFYSERAVDYFAGELERMIAWLQGHTPGRMDWERMRQVCEERNRAVEHELDLWDLLRHRPAPMAAEPIYLTHLLFGIVRAGTERATRTFEHILGLARRNLEMSRGALEDERYRVALWNPPTLIAIDLFAWAEQAYGAALIMDMLTYHRHPYIDTRTPQTMLRDLARCIMQGPMAKHTRGPAENFFSDLFHFYEHFDLDMIWMAGHIGCKNTQALSGMFREKCRDRDIPLLIIEYDLSDTRIVSPAGIRRQVEQFMETVMKAERLATPNQTERRQAGLGR